MWQYLLEPWPAHAGGWPSRTQSQGVTHPISLKQVGSHALGSRACFKTVMKVTILSGGYPRISPVCLHHYRYRGHPEWGIPIYRSDSPFPVNGANYYLYQYISLYISL